MDGLTETGLQEHFPVWFFFTFSLSGGPDLQRKPLVIYHCDHHHRHKLPKHPWDNTPAKTWEINRGFLLTARLTFNSIRSFLIQETLPYLPRG